jgi:D-methionine transport system ATP-binding protein
MIQISGLKKIYGDGPQAVRALENINLQVRKGEIFGIIGLSGAGKSTLIRCINMLERPTAGTVTVDDKEVTTMNERQLRAARQEIGMIFQHFNLLSGRTVFDNIAFPLEIVGIDKASITKRVTELLTLVGLADKADIYPAQLSGGQKQRVGIARALANNPKVLLCDEATSALDPQTTKSILELIKDIKEKLSLTVVLITHEMHVIKEICDTVAVIEHGCIIEQGPVLQIFTQPKQPTTRKFISAVIHHEVPDSLKSHMPEGLLVRIFFIGNSAGEPIISALVRRFNVDANILYGNIDHIQSTPFGTLLVELSGEAPSIQAALNYLNTRDLNVEVIGNVAGNARLIG